MKNLIIVTIIAAFFAACGNKAANESTTKVASLKTWVDSVKGVASATTTYDSAQWAGWNSSYEGVLAGINEAELDEANKATLAATKASWAEAGASYNAGMEKAKAEAMAKSMVPDSAAMAAPVTPVTPEATKEMKK